MANRFSLRGRWRIALLILITWTIVSLSLKHRYPDAKIFQSRKGSKSTRTVPLKEDDHKQVSLLHTTNSHPRPDGHFKETTKLKSEPFLAGCDDFPDTSDILLIMKTGATEAFDKLPIHFLTTLKCVKDVLLVADINLDMGGNHITDVLDLINDDEKRGNPDFDLYFQLKTYERNDLDAEKLRGFGSSWTLDKYKFLPMMKKAWNHRQDAAWYLFVEADTGVSWKNIRSFLDQLDSTEPLYLGSPTSLDINFAHGGTGFVISGAAMRKVFDGNVNILTQYGPEVPQTCCGDRMPARVLLDEDVGLSWTWPMFNGEKPLTVAYSKQQWCQPVITMHHMSPQEISEFWNFEQEWLASKCQRPILWMDVYDHFVHQILVSERSNWTNWAHKIHASIKDESKEVYDGFSKESITTAEDCKQLCEAHTDCLSWEHHDHICAIGKTFKFGRSEVPVIGRAWTSGWHLERIEGFRGQMGNCSQGPDWSYQKA